MGEDDESDDEDAVDSAEELENLNGDQWEDDEADVSKAQRKGVMGMKFMTDAEERQKQANALELAEIQKAVAIGSDEEDNVVEATSSSLTENPGRKTFIPGDQVAQAEKEKASRKQQEDTGEVVVLKVVKNPFHMSDVSSIQLGGIDK